MRLTIDLLPRGAWGNNLSKILSRADWDTLRNFCYDKANHRCSVCGVSNVQLNAHEVWDFDSASQTQTLIDIIALCTACHGVKHMRNSERMGYAEQAKAQFLKINGCGPMDYVAHYLKAKMRFDDLDKIERWTMVANLEKLGGRGIEVKQRRVPKIVNQYEVVRKHMDISFTKTRYDENSIEWECFRNCVNGII